MELFTIFRLPAPSINGRIWGHVVDNSVVVDKFVHYIDVLAEQFVADVGYVGRCHLSKLFI